jgi:hypothetical protein
MTRFRFGLLSLCLLPWPEQAFADDHPQLPSREFVAWVEQAPARSGLQPLDLVRDGERIRLHPGETLILGYFHTCNIETAIGGTLVVGSQGGSIEDGTLSKRHVKCDSDALEHDVNAPSNAAGQVVRDLDITTVETVYDPAPVFVVERNARTLKIGDAKGKTLYVMDVPGGTRVVDCRSFGIALEPGTYVASSDKETLSFRVEANTATDESAYLSRTVVLEP